MSSLGLPNTNTRESKRIAKNAKRRLKRLSEPGAGSGARFLGPNRPSSRNKKTTAGASTRNVSEKRRSECIFKNL